ncbi:MAG: hypothetical protein WCK05_01855 [Planctomycetota bacterium]
MRTNDRTIGQGRTLVVALMAAVVGTLAAAGGTLCGQTTEPAPAPVVTPAVPLSPEAPAAPAVAPTPVPEAPVAPAVAPTPVPEAPAAPAVPVLPVAPAPTSLSPAQAATGFSEQEAVLVTSVADGDEYWHATPLLVLLKHAAMLPPGDNADSKAEKIDLNALWLAPQKYRERLMPVAFEGWYAGRCERQEAGAKEWWPAGTFYLMHVSVAPIVKGKEVPIVLVALTKAPPADLALGTKVNFVGYFYKNALLPLDLKGSEKRINPVLVAKGVEVGTLETPARRKAFNPWGLAAAIVTLLGLGIYFQMRVRSHKQQAAMHQRVNAVTHHYAEEDADFDIDPALQQEVERFEAEQEASHHPKDTQ